MEKKWEIKSSKVISETGWEEDISQILLENRKIAPHDVENFFNPKHPQDITFQEAGIDEEEFKKFLKRLQVAHKKEEQIIIFGDYDVDGVSSTSILWMTLHKLGYRVSPFVPDRFLDGYGIKEATIEALKSQYPDLKLIITVDNGIVAHEALTFAKSQQIDVIVTDHHTRDDKPLDAHAIIHTTQLCGASISWLLARELLKEKVHADSLEKYLAIVGLATIADQMPLVELNRSFAVWGLKAINTNPPMGLKVLIDLSELNPRRVGVYEVGFILAPRLNAAGRIAHALDAVRLLCSPRLDTVRRIAQTLSELNTKRQQIVDEVMTSVSTDGKQKLLVVWDKPYHEGVIGLAASKLVEKYRRPAIVISKGESISKGSARSISGINITTLIREAHEYLIDGGGHEMAAGFSIDTAQIEAFVNKLIQVSETFIDETIFTQRIVADCSIPFSLVNEELLRLVKRFEPTGNGNPTPVFVSERVVIKDIKAIGSKKTHLKLSLGQEKGKVDAIFFNALPQFDKIKRGDQINILYRVDKNEWNGRISVQVVVKDIQLLNEKNNIS